MEVEQISEKPDIVDAERRPESLEEKRFIVRRPEPAALLLRVEMLLRGTDAEFRDDRQPEDVGIHGAARVVVPDTEQRVRFFHAHEGGALFDELCELSHFSCVHSGRERIIVRHYLRNHALMSISTMAI